MKKIIISCLSLLMMAACTSDLTSLNEDIKNPTVVPGQTLFSNAQKELADNMTSTNVNLNIFRLLAQYWTETTYVDESQYDLTTRSIPQTFWHALYRDVLKDFKVADSLIQMDENMAPAVKQNQVAIADMLQVYTYSVLVNTFGNIPYSQALNVNTTDPVYDDAAAIYDDLASRLDADLANLDPAAESFGEADLIYGGDVAKWVMFGNSLKLRMGMTIIDANPAKGQTMVEQAAPNVFKSNDDNTVFNYLTAPPNTNPIWVDVVQSGRKDYVIANTFVDKLNTLEDPRRASYFTLYKDSAYVGGIYGTSNNYQSFSHISDEITAPTFPGDLLDYPEVQFYLAEAAARGLNVTGTAEEHYNAAITASILYWGGTEADAVAYLAKPEVAYATAAGDFKEKIGIQKWISLYNRGFEAWTEWRRLDYPKLMPPADAQSEIPLRYTYPVSEQNLNTANFNEASKAIGGDVVATHLFWDVN